MVPETGVCEGVCLCHGLESVAEIINESCCCDTRQSRLAVFMTPLSASSLRYRLKSSIYMQHGLV